MLNKLLGITKNATEHGYQVDQMLEFVHWIMALLFVGWSIFFFTTLIKFHRSRNPKADYHGVRSKASTHVELMVVLVEAVFLVGFAFPIWGERVYGPRPDQEVDRVRVIAEQYKWNFHYPGEDGIFGRQKVELISAANPIGLDYSDPNAQDDIVAINEMHLQVNRSVITDISSKDVIHSYSVKHFRVTQDAIPGMQAPIWFKPIRTGEFEIVCAQLCGSGHYAMRGVVVVDTPEAFKEWKDEMLKMSAGARGGAANK